MYLTQFFFENNVCMQIPLNKGGAIALSYPPRVRVRATVKHSAVFFHDESSITIEGVRKCNSAINTVAYEN